jgi:hypothetical protein
MMQQAGKSDKNGGFASRTIENGTRIKMTVGEAVIPAVLNDGKSAKALIARLPYTVRLQKYAHDYCGVMREPLPYDAQDAHNGWLNGDIAFAIDGDYFTILYKDEEISRQYDGIVTLGVLDAPLSIMDTLETSISVGIELA